MTFNQHELRTQIYCCDNTIDIFNNSLWMLFLRDFRDFSTCPTLLFKKKKALHAYVVLLASHSYFIVFLWLTGYLLFKSYK